MNQDLELRPNLHIKTLFQKNKQTNKQREGERGSKGEREERGRGRRGHQERKENDHKDHTDVPFSKVFLEPK